MKKSTKNLLLNLVKEKGIVDLISDYNYKRDYIVLHLIEIKNNPDWYQSKIWEGKRADTVLTYENMWEICLMRFHRNYHIPQIIHAYKFIEKYNITE